MDDDDDEVVDDVVEAVFVGWKDGNESGVSMTERLALRPVSITATSVASCGS